MFTELIEGKGEILVLKGFQPLGLKSHSLCFQTSQNEGQKIHNSSHTFHSKIHPDGPEIALKENQNPTVFQQLGRLDGFSNGRYEKNHESFDLYAAKFESGAIKFWGEKITQVLEPFQNKDSSLVLYYKEQLMAISNSFKIAQKTALEAKGWLYTTGKVIQHWFIIDLYTQLAIYSVWL